MDTNFSRPSLGIAQSTLFDVSNAMANDKSLRFEFANDPQSFLNKQNVAISNGSLDTYLKTSEICSPPPVVLCFAGYYVVVVGAFVIAVAGAVVTAGYAAGGVRTVMSCWTEWGGCSIENPLLTEKFKGMC